MASKLFNYTRVKDTINWEGLLPGQRGKLAPNDVVIAGVVKRGETLENGQAVEVSYGDDGSAIFANATAANKFVGFVLQDILAQRNGETFGTPQFIYEYPAGRQVQVLTQGYIAVPLQTANPTVTAGGTVYIRTTAADGKQIGSIESLAANGTALTGVTFTGRIGFPLSGSQDGTTAADALTGRTALVLVQKNYI